MGTILGSHNFLSQFPSSFEMLTNGPRIASWAVNHDCTIWHKIETSHLGAHVTEPTIGLSVSLSHCS